MATTPNDMTVLNWARKVQAIAQTGLTFTQDPYDRERFLQLQDLAAELVSAELEIPLGQAKSFWKGDDGYATPKVDVRGAVFKGDQVLLVRELSDGKWSMPGGWVDVNDAPSEAVVREIFEESGYRAKALKLAALVDRNRHPHPPSVNHIYKLFFLCEITGGSPTISNETDSVDFFPVTALPELSTGRTLATQVARMYEHWLNRDLPTDFD
jgi:ADP-ribose pyrophosphatase YjhB (NUDIX family)